MTTHTFYQQFEQNTSKIQQLASKLAKDFDTARFLYLETAHQALKYKNQLKKENFDQWLIDTMKKTYRKLRKK